MILPDATSKGTKHWEKIGVIQLCSGASGEVVCVMRVQLGSFRGAGHAAQADGLEVAVYAEGLVKKNVPDNNRLIKMYYRASF